MCNKPLQGYEGRYLWNGCKRIGRIEWCRTRRKTDLEKLCGGWAGRKV